MGRLFCVHRNHPKNHVEESKERLACGLRTSGLFLLPGITRLNHFESCDKAIKRAVSEESIRSTRALREWRECGDDCGSCLMISKRKEKKCVTLWFMVYTMV